MRGYGWQGLVAVVHACCYSSTGGSVFGIPVVLLYRYNSTVAVGKRVCEKVLPQNTAEEVGTTGGATDGVIHIPGTAACGCRVLYN